MGLTAMRLRRWVVVVLVVLVAVAIAVMMWRARRAAAQTRPGSPVDYGD